jgi:hypothetical protein
MATNDIIIGMAAGYSWRELEPFIVSLRRSGYTGRCVLLFDEKEVIDEQLSEKISEYGIGIHKANLQEEHPIIARFRIMASWPTDDVRYMMSVDTRDIVFQSDPFAWIEKNIGNKEIMVVSEGVRYENSEGNKKNILDAFGPQKFDDMRHKWVCNAGVIAGVPETLKLLFTRIYNYSKKDLRLKSGKPTYNEMLPDQTAMNILIRWEEPWRSKTKVFTVRDGFVFGNHHYPLEFPVPVLRDGLLYLDDSQIPVPIFHQYDQNDNFRDAVRARWKE